MRPHMARPQIRPPIFIALQNGMAATLCLSLLAQDALRHLLHFYPESAALWWLSVQANRTLMPVMAYLERYLETSEQVRACLLAGIVVCVIAWRTRYWLATALAGHLALAAFAVITRSIFSRGTVWVRWYDIPGLFTAGSPSVLGLFFLGLTVFALVMCLADHLAFFRFFVGLFRRRRSGAETSSTGDLRSL